MPRKNFLLRSFICTYFLPALALSVSESSLSADWKEDTGYNQLLAEQGASLADGTGVKVSMVEAGDAYTPDSTNAEFSGKTIVDQTGTSTGNSGHADSVALNFFGNTTSAAGGVKNITVFGALDFLDNVLNTGNNAPPAEPDYKVQNHSYRVDGGSDSINEQRHIRLDYVIDTFDVTTVVALNNGNANNLPNGMAQGYNTISVGRTDGNHSYDTTHLNGAGRIKPDIVAPAGTTSNATPLVSSVAAMLHEVGSATPNATKSETIKAIIMAGATKHDVTDWDRTNSQPLDTVYGAGELNVYNSFHIMTAGESDGSTTKGGTNIGLNGWDYNEKIEDGSPVFYDFNVADGQTLSELSILLTWHREFEPNEDWSGGNLFPLADVNLTLYDSLNSPVDFSNSAVDNVEHIYVQDLASGDYYFEVVTNIDTDYAVAWRATAVPEPGAFYLMLVASGVIGIVCVVRRWQAKAS